MSSQIAEPPTAIAQRSLGEEPPREAGPLASLVESVRLAMEETHYPSLRRLCCEVSCGVLILSGRVPSYFLRQVALATARKAAAPVKIEDHMLVR